MDLLLADKVVFITGASGGIGRAMAEAFAAEGALLALHGNQNFPELESWLADRSWSERALALRADVSRPEEMQAAFEQTLQRWDRVDVCLANAGVWPKQHYHLHESPEERVRRTIDVNLMGAIWTARSFVTSLAESGPRSDGQGASLIFTGSTAARFGERGHAEYAIAKSGLYGLVQSLKNEIVTIDPYARVNVIEPGWTVTHMARPALDEPGTIGKVVRTMPLRQLGRAKDIARTALWLASPAMARHVTGQAITVAGGMEGRTLWEAEEIDEDGVRNRLRE